jgi:hypothetical protein
LLANFRIRHRRPGSYSRVAFFILKFHNGSPV